MPNTFAYLMFFAWPVVTIVLFRRLSLQSAVLWSIIAGYLLLPERTGFDLPLVPAISKHTLPAIVAAIGCLIYAGRRSGPILPRGTTATAPAPTFTVHRGRSLFLLLVGLLFLTPVITVLTNGEPVVWGEKVISGLRVYDIFSIEGELFLTLLPFFLARRFLYDEEGQEALLRILVAAALAYSLLVLWEVRMSPFLNKNIYGFFQHSFAQHARDGGWRPKVFLNHGLWLGIFEAMAVLSAVAMWRVRKGTSQRAKWLVAAVYLFAVLVLTKALGAYLLALVFAPVILFLGVRAQLMVAAVVAGIAMTYPLLRGADLVPTDRLHRMALSFSEERGQSLQYRFDNEDILLDRANQKPLAGWGSWGRPRVSNEKGQTISTSDGYWIIVIGVYGWLGYIAQFGLMGMPLVLYAMNRKRLGVSTATAGLGLVMAVSMIDLIPNGTMTALTWLVAGALFGRFQTLEAKVSDLPVRSAQPVRQPAAPRPAPQPATGPAVTASRGPRVSKPAPTRERAMPSTGRIVPRRRPRGAD